MKLRIKGQSIRFRLSRSDVARFIDLGSIEEAVYFAPEENARLSYILLHRHSESPIRVAYQENAITVIVATDIVKQWADAGVEIQQSITTSHGGLEILIEKDFACLHGTTSDNEDAFPNPLEAAST